MGTQFSQKAVINLAPYQWDSHDTTILHSLIQLLIPLGVVGVTHEDPVRSLGLHDMHTEDRRRCLQYGILMMQDHPRVRGLLGVSSKDHRG